MSSSVSDLLESMPGLERAKASLPAIIDVRNGIQFVILYGAPDSGQEELGRCLVQGWLCTGPDPKPCGTCGPCKAFANSRAVDCLTINPYGASRTLKLSCLRHDGTEDDYKGVLVFDFIRTRPLMSPSKVVWFTEADRMQHRVANALLKTLEELPPYLRFVFTTDELNKIPATVRSRALLVACESPKPADWPNDWGQDELLTRFARTPGDAMKVNARRKTFEKLETLLVIAVKAPEREALRLAEEMGQVMDEYCDGAKTEKRKGQLEVLEFASTWILSVCPEQTQWVQAMTKAHRRVNGNAQIRFALQALFLTGTLAITN